MNRTDFVDAFASKLNVTKKEARSILSAYEATVVEGLKNDGRIALSGFGTFEKKITPEHEGRNPATNSKITIPAKLKITFKAAKAVKQEVEGGKV